MKIGQLIDIRQNFDTSIENELLRMDVFFQNHLWDGFSDPADARFISNDDFEAIQALTDKIEHMVLNIGCPNSVKPMLKSICNRKIKYWCGYDLYCCDKGEQLKTKDKRNMVKKATEFEWQRNGILKGHFRWNNRGYMLSRKATDLLELYYEMNFK